MNVVFQSKRLCIGWWDIQIFKSISKIGQVNRGNRSKRGGFLFREGRGCHHLRRWGYLEKLLSSIAVSRPIGLWESSGLKRLNDRFGHGFPCRIGGFSKLQEKGIPCALSLRYYFFAWFSASERGEKKGSCAWVIFRISPMHRDWLVISWLDKAKDGLPCVGRLWQAVD